MAEDVKTLAIVRFRPRAERAGCYDVEIDITGNANLHGDGFCQLPPTYDGVDLKAGGKPPTEDGVVDRSVGDGPPTEEGVVWRKGGTEASAETFLVSDLEMLERAGAHLFEELFSEGVRAVLKSQAQSGIALRFDLTRAPALSQEPFEALFLEDGKVLLGTQVNTPISRLLQADGIGRKRPELKPPACGLFAAAAPAEDIDYATEIESIKRHHGRLSELNAKHPAIEWKFEEGLTRQSFVAALSDVPTPDIVHFVGHGGIDGRTGQPYVTFHDSLNGRLPDPVPAEDFRAMLQNSSVSLVVLNSCGTAQTSSSDVFSGVAQGLIRNWTPFVVAMRGPISDEAALIFSENFYTSLARLATPEEAITCARNAIRTTGSNARRKVEFATPVLYTTGERETLYHAIADRRPSSASAWYAPYFRGLRRGGKFIGWAAGLAAAIVAVLTFFGPESYRKQDPEPEYSRERQLPPRAREPTQEATYRSRARFFSRVFVTDRIPIYRGVLSRDRQWTYAAPPVIEWDRTEGQSWAESAPCSDYWRPSACGEYPLSSQASPGPPLCGAGPYRVFFDWNSVELTLQARATLDRAAAAYAQCRPGQAEIVGYSDPAFAQWRADNVRHYLGTRGVPYGLMRVEAFGESRPWVGTGDGTSDPENRRVVITYEWARPPDLPPGIAAVFERGSTQPRAAIVHDLRAAARGEGDGGLELLLTGWADSIEAEAPSGPGLARLRARFVARLFESEGLPSQILVAVSAQPWRAPQTERNQATSGRHVSARLTLQDAGAVQLAPDSGGFTADGRAAIQRNAEWLDRHPGFGLWIRGTAGASGAERVAAALVDRRVGPERLVVDRQGDMWAAAFGNDEAADSATEVDLAILSPGEFARLKERASRRNAEPIRPSED